MINPRGLPIGSDDPRSWRSCPHAEASLCALNSFMSQRKATQGRQQSALNFLGPLAAQLGYGRGKPANIALPIREASYVGPGVVSNGVFRCRC